MPARLSDDADAETLCFEHATDDGHTEARVIDVGVAGHQNDVAGIPAEQIHLLAGHGQERRRREPRRPELAIPEQVGSGMHGANRTFRRRSEQITPSVTLDTASYFIIAATFALAGLVKGVIGLGLPSISLGILTATVGLTPAMALMLAPSFVTNAWQAVVGGHFRALLRRCWPFLLAATVTIWLGAQALSALDLGLLSALLGVLLSVYALNGLLGVRLSLPPHVEPWAGPLAGIVNGVLTGMTGSFVVPGVAYLQALGLARDALVQAMGILFTLSTVALALALGGEGLLSTQMGIVSALGVIPAIFGMTIGQRLRQRLSEARFRRVFFCALLLLGIYIVVRALAR